MIAELVRVCKRAVSGADAGRFDVETQERMEDLSGRLDGRDPEIGRLGPVPMGEWLAGVWEGVPGGRGARKVDEGERGAQRVDRRFHHLDAWLSTDRAPTFASAGAGSCVLGESAEGAAERRRNHNLAKSSLIVKYSLFLLHHIFKPEDLGTPCPKLCDKNHPLRCFASCRQGVIKLCISPCRGMTSAGCFLG